MVHAVPAEELPVLDSLVNIRNRLVVLKRANSGSYVKAHDVQSIFEQTVEQIERLNQVREGAAALKTNGEDKTTAGEMELNRVDYTLADCFQIISLFYLTIGKNKESPATYCQLATLKRLLDHLAESNVYTISDIKSFSSRLEQLRSIIDRSQDAPEALQRILMRKYNACQRILKDLMGALSELSPQLVPIHQKLITIRRQLAACAARPKPSKTELEALQEELRAIDHKRVDGKFINPKTGKVPEGQALCLGLLEENYDLCQDILARPEDVAIPLQPIYERLSEMKSQLERLLLTHRWTLRETDLYSYQLSLAELDGMRVDGKFVDADGKKPEGQLVLLYLLRRCYGLTYKLLSASEPIAEELMPVANKLSTIKRCLTEIKKFGGPYSARDLYPYSMALSQIDDLRVDGKFLASDGSVPEGQGLVATELAESYSMLQEMREENEELDDGDDGDE